MARRAWRKWAPDFVNKGLPNPVTMSVLAIGGIAATLVTAPFTLPVGLAAVGGATLWAACSSFPKRFLAPTDLEGKEFTLSELNEIDPPPLKLGIVGNSLVGKTQLLDRIGHRIPQNLRTHTVYAYLFRHLQTGRFFALLDGEGNTNVQQFKIAANAVYLIIMLDHSATNKDRILDRPRLKDHETFLDQLRRDLEQEQNSINTFKFLLNKRDLWENSGFEKELLPWFDQQVDSWRRAFSGKTTTSQLYSNQISDDLPHLLNDIAHEIK